MDRTLSLTFLGTGCSSANPSTNCLLKPDERCPACADAFKHPETSPNVRYNTSAVVQTSHSCEQGSKTILIDCGKTFRESVFKWFPQRNITRIDALILTHAHTDAYGGLDDIRPWFQGAKPLQEHLDIYCTKLTRDAIYASFPWYFPSKKKSSAKLPEFMWHVMPDNDDWNICGVVFSPFHFHHGRVDVNWIPEAEWARLAQKVALPSLDGRYDDERRLPHLQLAILDITGEFHESPAHFNLGQAILCSRRLGALKTYLTGFLHGYTHKTWLDWCKMFQDRPGDVPSSKDENLRDKPLWWKQLQGDRRPVSQANSRNHNRQWTKDEFFRLALSSIRHWESEAVGSNPYHLHLHGKHVRPAYDGLTIEWREWGTGEHGHSAHEDRIVREYRPQHATL
ncbi:hypothetical protein B0A53_06255 [Rhodotorula sp. CCFEE 5036]|nr:hypothetical protein B0A53_06255 [Rhodotorula sp. CCFEE 5036]